MPLNFELGEGWGDQVALGLVVLQTDETLEQEFRLLMPPDIFSLYHCRIPSSSEVTEETLTRMADEIPAAVSLLPINSNLKVVGYACTSGTTVIGEDRVRELVWSVRPSVVVTTPLTAAKAAIRVLRIRRLGFLTPYVAEVSKPMRQHFEDDGIKITSFGSFEQAEEATVARITPHSILEAIIEIGKKSDSDGVFVACTNLQTANILALAEEQLGKPVISSTQALAWHMAYLAKRPIHPAKYGRLFDARAHSS